MRKISLILPSRQRPIQAMQVLKEWVENCDNLDNLEIIVSTDESDTGSLYRECQYKKTTLGIEQICNSRVICNPNNNLVQAANAGAKEATGDILILISDDFACIEHWDTHLLKEIGGTTDFVLMTKDGTPDQTILTLPLMDRVYYERYGYVYHPAYKHLFSDTHLMSVAQLTGKLIQSNLEFKHNHYTLTGGKADEVSHKANKTWAEGETLYLNFSYTNFGIPPEELIGSVDDLQPMQWLREQKGITKVILTIAIPTVVGREKSYERVYECFEEQRNKLANPNCVEIIFEKDNKELSIGEKRNKLAKRAQGLFIVMNDDDDIPPFYYLETIIPVLERNPEIDNIGHLEHCFMDGKQYSSVFSNVFKEWADHTAGYDYVRTPFYKCPIKTSHVRQVGFKDLRYAEDHNFAIRLKESGLLQREYFINKVLYMYAPKPEGSFDERYGFNKSSDKYVALSCTEEDIYAYFLPLTVWAWQQWGFEPIIFIPENDSPILKFSVESCTGKFQVYKYTCEEKRKATYSQCSRLFAAAINIPDNAFLITGDVDMLPCNDYFSKLRTEHITVIGEDLTDYKEYPMCYIGMQVGQWRHIFGINNRTYQQCLEELIDNIEGENIRGEQWFLDQWYATKKIKESGLPVLSIERGRDGGGGALNRSDRDGWAIQDYCIDSHLPRPGYLPENLEKICQLLLVQFPDKDFKWFEEYTEKYLQRI